MAKKKKRPASLATRIARVKRKLAAAERKIVGNPGRGGMKTYARLQRSLRKMLTQQSKKAKRSRPNPLHKGKTMFHALGDLPPGRYVISRRKGSRTLSVSKFLTKKKKRR